MTEPRSEWRDGFEPAAADTDHSPSDFAAGGYDDRQDSGDASPEESEAYETGTTEAGTAGDTPGKTP